MLKKTVDSKIHNVIIDWQLNCKRKFSSAKQIYFFYCLIFVITVTSIKTIYL
jgi:hypothetical protein